MIHVESTCMTTSLRVEVWAHKTSLSPPLFIEVSVPRQKCELSCICLLGVSPLPLSTILIFDFEIVSTAWIGNQTILGVTPIYNVKTKQDFIVCAFVDRS